MNLRLYTYGHVHLMQRVTHGEGAKELITNEHAGWSNVACQCHINFFVSGELVVTFALYHLFLMQHVALNTF